MDYKARIEKELNEEREHLDSLNKSAWNESSEAYESWKVYVRISESKIELLEKLLA